MKDIIECKDVVKFFAVQNADFQLVVDNYAQIEEIILTLDTIHKTTVLLQRADATLSDYFGATIEMREKLKILKKDNNRKTDLADCLIVELNKRKPQMLQNEAMLCAVYLDRRFSIELSESKKKLRTNVFIQIVHTNLFT